MDDPESAEYVGATMTQTWNAGELGCSRLVLELRDRMAQLAPGEELELTALDPGAPIDLPAWCQMTGHKLISKDHPVYVIRCKQENG